MSNRIPLTSDHDAAKLCLSQGVDNICTIWLHQVLHHKKTQEVHVLLYFLSVDRHKSINTQLIFYCLKKAN